MTEEHYQIKFTCDECGTSASDHHRYCRHCGAYLGEQAVTINIFNNVALRRVFIFYFIYLFICLLVKHTNWFNSYDEMFWVEIFLAIVTTYFAWQNRVQMRPVMRFNNFKWYVLLAVIAIAASASCLGACASAPGGA